LYIGTFDYLICKLSNTTFTYNKRQNEIPVKQLALNVIHPCLGKSSKEMRTSLEQKWLKKHKESKE
jgi:hypothetical protein